MKKSSFIILGLIFCLVVILSSSCGGTHGKIKNYDFNYSKPKVYQAIKSFLETSPQYKVPDAYYSYTWHYGGDRTTKDEWIQQANADSVSFSFYFPDDNIIMYCLFSGHAEAWYASDCTLLLIGYIKPNETKWKFDSDIWFWEKGEITDKFESLILNKISDELKKD